MQTDQVISTHPFTPAIIYIHEELAHSGPKNCAPEAKYLFSRRLIITWLRYTSTPLQLRKSIIDNNMFVLGPRMDRWMNGWMKKWHQESIS